MPTNNVLQANQLVLNL